MGWNRVDPRYHLSFEVTTDFEPDHQKSRFQIYDFFKETEDCRRCYCQIQRRCAGQQSWFPVKESRLRNVHQVSSDVTVLPPVAGGCIIFGIKAGIIRVNGIPSLPFHSIRPIEHPSIWIHDPCSGHRSCYPIPCAMRSTHEYHLPHPKSLQIRCSVRKDHRRNIWHSLLLIQNVQSFHRPAPAGLADSRTRQDHNLVVVVQGSRVGCINNAILPLFGGRILEINSIHKNFSLFPVWYRFQYCKIRCCCCWANANGWMNCCFIVWWRWPKGSCRYSRSINKTYHLRWRQITGRCGQSWRYHQKDQPVTSPNWYGTLRIINSGLLAKK